jgi:hypothetical protein
MKENCFQKYWRPSAAITYLIICTFDFIIAPVLWNLLQFYSGATVTPYSPLTLQGSGLLHISFGAFIGIYSHGRSREKCLNINKES